MVIFHRSLWACQPITVVELSDGTIQGRAMLVVGQGLDGLDCVGFVEVGCRARRQSTPLLKLITTSETSRDLTRSWPDKVLFNSLVNFWHLFPGWEDGKKCTLMDKEKPFSNVKQGRLFLSQR